jgi:hypothetical protein
MSANKQMFAPHSAAVSTLHVSHQVNDSTAHGDSLSGR